MKQQPSDTGFHPIRRDQLHQEREHDSYRQQGKPSEPAACSECGASFHAGRWQWGEKQENAALVLCPACQRIRDDFPAGFVHLGGAFFVEHRQEILSLIQHHTQKERAEHPLARIMAITEDASGEGGIVITTTDLHLARDIGDALHKAYHGELDFHYNEAEKRLRVHWCR
ncbi:ATPase [Dechloromonas denitrificans]|uniref:ATPase n=1 Tax=Dechloromonas denitrificans TaxID=281362 RepID=A0A133XP61_9RHOO|nr:BCAM0308 family protein [Dechloromonas denitrificans]KXB32709.1 ATPase [Dechloromonas denitrificans]